MNREAIDTGVCEHIDFTTGEVTSIPFPKGLHCTDAGNAERFLFRFGKWVRYCSELKTWFIWDHVRWQPDTVGRIYELAKETAMLIHDEVSGIADRGERKKVSDHAFRSENMHQIESMLKYASTDESISLNVSDFDANPWLINCPNGTLDLKAHELRKPRRSDLITRVTPWPYDPDAESVEWYERLLEVLSLEEGAFLQRAAGSALTGINRDKALFFLYGKPNARKSTLLEAIFKAYGDYASPVDISTFARGPQRAGGARPDLISLIGVRAAQCSEVPKRMKFNDAFFKAIVGANPRKARDLFEKGMRDIEPTAKFFIETNFMPVIDPEDEAAYNRCSIIKFKNTIPLEDCDPKIKEFLLEDENAQKAIFAWLVEGCYAWQEYGLMPPASVSAAREEYKKSMNPIAEFIAENTVAHPDEWVETDKLYNRFEAVASKEERHNVRTYQSFATYLTKLGIESKHTNTGNVRLGIRLLKEDEEALLKSEEVKVARGSFYKFSHVEDYKKKIAKKGIYASPLHRLELELKDRLRSRLLSSSSSNFNSSNGAVSVRLSSNDRVYNSTV